MAALGSACDDSTSSEPDAVEDTGGGSDTKDVVVPTSKWTTAVVDDTGKVGRHIRMAITAGGNASIAYFATTGTDGEDCTELGDQPPKKTYWPLYYAEQGADGSWTRETIVDLLINDVPPGLDYKTDPSTGAPTVASLSGEPVAQYEFCGANDLALYTPTPGGGWDYEVAVTDSGQAATGEAGSDFGFAVGYWPGLAFDSAGNVAVAYKDVHAGGLQTDDLRRADLELAWNQSGGWSYLPVEVGKGAGNFNSLAFDDQDRPIILFHNPTDDVSSNHGLWVARSSDGGATWEKVLINIGKNAERPALAVDPNDGTVWVAFYKFVDGLPYVARLKDPNQFENVAAGWELTEIGDHRYREGLYPNLAFAPDGRLAISYYRCNRSTNTNDDCSPAEDGVVFAWLEDGEWEREVVDEGEKGLCGTYTTLGFRGDGSPVIAYQCAVDTGGGKFDFEVRAATREPLP